MATVRKRFRVTTLGGGQGDAVQRNLASETRVVSPAEEVVFAVETFAHAFDPVAFRTALAYAKDPLLGGRFNVQSGRNEGGRRASVMAPKLEAMPMAVGAEGAQAYVASPNAQGARLGSPSAPMVEPWYSTLRRAIVNLPADAQADAVKTCLDNVLVALRALNVSPQAIMPFRALCERKWGYPRENTNQYYTGVPGAIIADYNEALWYTQTQPFPSPVGEWREEIARRADVSVRNLRLQGWDVVIGRKQDQNLTNIGCRWSQGRSASLPSGCDRPTGECHTFWVQADAQLYGGRLYYPSQLESMQGAPLDTDALEWSTRRMPSGVKSVGRGDAWDRFFFEVDAARRKLFVTVPPSLYFDLFYTPQPEFGNLTFVDWLGSVDPDEVVRTIRRENSKRLARFASRLGVRVNELIGKGEAELARRAIREEQERQAAEGVIGASVGGISQIAGPVVSLVAGAGNAIAALFKATSDDARTNPANVYIDVFGQLMPAFSQFHIAGGVEEFEHLVASEIVNIPAPSPTFAVSAPVFLPGMGGGSQGPMALFDTMPATGVALEMARPPEAPSQTALQPQPNAPARGLSTGAVVGAVGVAGVLGVAIWKRDAIRRWWRKRQ